MWKPEHRVAAKRGGLRYPSDLNDAEWRRIAPLIPPALPATKVLIGDKGYDSDALRQALAAKGIEPCIPPKRNRKIQHFYCKTLYKQRHKIENMFGRIKDWRRIAMRYDRCAHTLFSAICIAVILCYYLNQ